MYPMFAFIPWLAGLLSSLVAYFLGSVTKKFLARLAVGTAIIALAAAFTAALAAVVINLQYISPDSYFLAGISLMPANTIPCVSAYLSSAVIRVVYNQRYDYISRWLN